MTLSLQGGSQSVPLPLELRRRDVTRAELLGRLGMVPMAQPGKRFSIRHLATPEFIRGVNAIADGETSSLVIPVTVDELEQFDLS